MKKSSTLLLGFCFGCAEEPQQVEDVIQQDSDMVTWRVDFDSANSDQWFALNDDVMGGVSVGDAFFTDSTVVFEGAVSTQNNGGFVSFRSPNNEYDLSQFSQVEISYKSEGHAFSMVLADELMWYMPQFRHEATSPSDDWTTTTFSLYDFRQYITSGYGQSETAVEVSAELLSNIVRIELINSEFEDGDFRLEIDYIEFQGMEDSE